MNDHQCTVCHTCHFDADNTHVLVVLKMYYFSKYSQIPVYFISGVSAYELYVLMRSGFLGPSFNLPSGDSAFFLCFICDYIIMLHLYVCAKFGEYWSKFRVLN